MSSSPQFLYHYTSINTLGFILMNKSFRFNSLKNMDDFDEVKILNKELGKYCFVSCWTSEEEESIPMWKMYANDLKGVRIKLPIFPFEVFKENGKEFIINPKDCIQDKYYYWKPYDRNFLRCVDYKTIEEVERIKNGEIAQKNLDYFGYDLYLPGFYKNDYWAFQKEWRYRIMLVPTRERVDDLDSEDIDYTYIKGLPDLPFWSKELKIKDDVFKRMELTLGPKVNDSDKIMIELMLEKFNPGIKVRESRLKSRL